LEKTKFDVDVLCVGGLLIKRPLYFDNYKTGRLYRDFETGQDIRKTERALEAVIAFDELLGLMEIPVAAVSADIMLTFKNFILTLWSRYVLELSPELKPLSLNQVKSFFRQLWSDDCKDGNKPRVVDSAMRQSFLAWFANTAGRTPDDIIQAVGQPLEDLLNELEVEYGRISQKDLKTQYIRLFLVTE